MSSEQNQMLVAGPTNLIVGVAPEPPHQFVVLLSVEDPDYGTVNVSLGVSDDLTEVIAGMIRSQNMLGEAERYCTEQGCTDVPSRLRALGEITSRYPQVDDFPIVDGD